MTKYIIITGLMIGALLSGCSEVESFQPQNKQAQTFKDSIMITNDVDHNTDLDSLEINSLNYMLIGAVERNLESSE